MPDTPETLSVRLENEGERVLAFFGAVALDQWEAQVYSDGQAWKVQQILAHMVDTEANICLLIDNIAGGGEGAPEGFQINAHNESAVGKMLDRTPADLLASFQDLRRETVHKVAQLPPGALERMGRHPFMGITTLSEIIKLMYVHAQIHMRDIRRVLKDK